MELEVGISKVLSMKASNLFNTLFKGNVFDLILFFVSKKETFSQKSHQVNP